MMGKEKYVLNLGAFACEQSAREAVDTGDWCDGAGSPRKYQ
jgi:hypothetical protein